MLGPQIEQVMTGQGSAWNEGQSLPRVHDRRFDDAYWTYSFSPLDDPDAPSGVGGVLAICHETTGTGLAERRLSEAEARGVLESMGEAFILLDRDFHIRRINAEGLRIDGRSQDEIVGRHLLQVWPEAETLPSWALFQRVMQDRRSAEVTYRHQSVARDVWLEVRVHPSGEGVAAFYRNVTAAKHAEVALKDSEARARDLAAQQAATLGQLAEGVIVTDAEGRITLVNEAASRIHGVRRLDVVPDNYSQAYSLLTEDGRPYPSLDLPLALAVRGEAVVDARWRIQRPDGDQVVAVGNAKPLLDDTGRQTGAVLTLRDDTARVRAETALRDLNDTLEAQVAERTEAARTAEARFRGIFNSTYQLIGLTSLEGTVVEANRAALNAASIDGSGMVGLPMWNTPWFCRSPDAVTALKAAFPAVAAGEFIRTELTLVLPDDRVRTYDFSLSPVRDEEGQIAFIVAEGHDITERKQLEEQLRQAQKMEAVGQLTGGLAHDFNNLLAGISGSLELLQTRVAQGRLGDLDRYLVAAQGASKRAAALTHRLLAFTRRQTLDPKPTDMNRLVTGMEELVRRTVGPSTNVEVVGAGGLWTVLVDPNQLENALLNLCINARDAMPDGGRLTIETGNRWLDERTARSRDLPPGQYVSLCVSDTGTGMTPEVIRRAFDPFFTTKPIGMGTGLGLSMIYGFVQQSGGQSRIYSEVGQGTMVCLYLPRHIGQAEIADGPGELAVAPHAEQGETVLVIDDEPTVRMLVTEVLEDLGYTAIEAADGPAGLQVLRSDIRLDLLVTDVGLPGMNGRQVADAGRAVRPDLKVLFITGYAENAVLSHGHLDPGMHVLTKPFAMEALASRIKSLIAGA